MTNHDNLVIYMADSVRKDFFPEFNQGVTVDAIAEGRNTPQSFTGMLSGVGPARHGVTWFDQTTQVPTVLNLDQMGYRTGYWDHPDSPLYSMFKHRNRKKFEEIADKEENFVFVRRDTVPHLPYANSWEEGEELGQDAEEDSRGTEYIEILRVVQAIIDRETDLTWKDVPERGQKYMEDMREFTEWQKKMLKKKFPYKDHYIEGVEKSKEKFLELVDQAKELGVYENTLFIYCTDHGDCLPFDETNAIGHAHPVRSVIDIKCHFHNAEKQDVEPFLKFGEFQVKNIPKVWNKNWDIIKGGLEVKNARRPEEAEKEDEIEV